MFANIKIQDRIWSQFNVKNWQTCACWNYWI